MGIFEGLWTFGSMNPGKLRVLSQILDFFTVGAQPKNFTWKWNRAWWGGEERDLPRSIFSAWHTYQEKTKIKLRSSLFQHNRREEFNERFGDTCSDLVSTHFIRGKSWGGFVRVTVTAVNSSLLQNTVLSRTSTAASLSSSFGLPPWRLFSP